MTNETFDGVRAGMLTPSSNTALEPYTSAIFAAAGQNASAHFGRFRVVEISMSGASQDQFQNDPIMEAADRLAEAHPGLIAWNGTSASWLGLEKDRALCGSITKRTGCAATSTVLAYDEIFEALGVKTLGLVTPYIDDIQDRIIANYAQQSIDVIADARLHDKGNYSFATYTPEYIARLIEQVAEAKPDAISILCTNFRGAPVADALEQRLGLPVLDSVSVTAAYCLHKLGVDTTRVQGWGSVFSSMTKLSRTLPNYLQQEN